MGPSSLRTTEDARAQGPGVLGASDQGIRQGAPEQTSVTAPPVWRKSDFCCRASASLRGAECGSAPVIGAVLVMGGVAAPLSQTTKAGPVNGRLWLAGMV